MCLALELYKSFANPAIDLNNVAYVPFSDRGMKTVSVSLEYHAFEGQGSFVNNSNVDEFVQLLL